VIFGNPIGGTPAMVSSPLAAIDLPLRVLVWKDDRLLLSRGSGLPPNRQRHALIGLDNPRNPARYAH